jgi:DNA polymerase alpha subunit A
MDDADVAYAHDGDFEESLTVSSAASAAAEAASGKDVAVDDFVQDGRCLVYWYDVHEEFGGENNGQIYLFGKAIQHSSVAGRTAGIAAEELVTRSVCLVVKNVERDLYVLPRKYKLADAADVGSVTEEPVSLEDVYKELKERLGGYGAVRMKPATRKYAFARSLNTGADARDAELQSRAEAKARAELDADEEEPEDVLPCAGEIPLSRRSLLDPENIVPVAEAAYMNVRYSFKYPTLNRGTVGKTFSHVFGSMSSRTECFLLDRKLRGPSWVTVKQPTVVVGGDKLSYCDLELVVDSPSKVEVFSELNIPPPLFTVASLALQTHITPSKAGQHQEIVMATFRIHRGVSVAGVKPKMAAEEFVIVRAPAGSKLPFDFRAQAAKPAIAARHGNVQIADTETQMLTFLFNRLDRAKADVLLGHDLYGTVLDIIVSSARRNNIGVQWSKLGLLRRRAIPRSPPGGRSLVDYGVGSGRLLCDTMSSCQEFSPQRQYTLQHLMEEFFDEAFLQTDPARIHEYFDKTDSLLKLMRINQTAAIASFRIMVKLEILPLTHTLTALCGNRWVGSLRSARSERVEFLLLHEFTSKGFIAPEAYSKQELEARMREEAKWLEAENDEAEHAVANATNGKKPKYMGGMVLEPKRGFYDQWVSVLDFNSLYPSIIREYNLCFSTSCHWRFNSFADDNEQLVKLIPDEETGQGVLPTVVKYLIERRKAVKSNLKTAAEADRASLNIRQLALKLVANAMYGCLGFTRSRFYCQPLAALITLKGRHALEKAVRTANGQGATIIYGDTDSIMLNTNTDDYKQATILAKQVKKAVNQGYKVLNIDEDGYFNSMLLLRKKKYAALKLDKTTPYNPQTEQTEVARAVQTSRNAKKMGASVVRRAVPEQKLVFHYTREAKGLDLVRRDWSQLSRKASVSVLDAIMSGMSRDETISHINDYLQKLAMQMGADELPVTDYVMTKTLTKNIDSYNNVSLPHVSVARKMRDSGIMVRAGDVIEYVMVAGEGGQSDRAMSFRQYQGLVLESRKPNGPKAPALDMVFYKEQQLLAPIMRLLDVFEEVTKAGIADCLGLDGSKFVQRAAPAEHQEDVAALMQSPYHLFKHMEPLYIDCPHCDCHFPFVGAYNYAPAQAFIDTLARDSPAPLNAGTVAMLMHSSKAYRTKVAAASSKSGFVCPTPGCPGAVVVGAKAHSANDQLIGQICNRVTVRARALLQRFHQHRFLFSEDGGATITRTDLTHRNQPPTGRDVPEQQLTTEIRYLLSLFDLHRARVVLADEFETRSKKAEGSGTNVETDMGPQVTWMAAGPNDQQGMPVVDGKTDVKAFFQKNRLVGLAPLRSELDLETQRVLDAVHQHCQKTLLEQCDPCFVSLGSIFSKIFSKTVKSN